MSSPDPAFDPGEVRGHIERLVGSIAATYPSGAGIDICHVTPTERRPFHTLITCGMSARPMAVPASEPDAPRYLELMMTLPEDWKLDSQSQADPAWNWPLAELARVAALPFSSPSSTSAWLGWGHAVPHGNPPVPYAPGTKLCGVIIAPSLLVKEAFYELQLGRHRVAFFSAIPLYREELDLLARAGMQELLGKLIDNELNDVVEPQRKNVAKRFFGLF